jgi:hypothetical protein
MSKEFERLKSFLYWSEPADWEPQVDRGEAAKLAARWGWLLRQAREQRIQPSELRGLDAGKAVSPPRAQ